MSSKHPLSTLSIKTNTYANSVDPDEPSHNEQSHQDLYSLPPIGSRFLIGIPIYKNGRVQG